MSDTPVEITKVVTVQPHPNADRLEIATVLSTQFVCQKGSLEEGELVVYFPPDMLIPEDVAENLGVRDYLKHSVYPGDMLKTKCRISAIRLRGVSSFGFGLPMTDEAIITLIGTTPCDVDLDLSEVFGAVKYQPPEPKTGDTQRQPGAFHTYTNIQHYYRYSRALPAGTPVRITEKLHGTNSRVGGVRDNGWEFMCGTHHRRVKAGSPTNGRCRSLYWDPLTDDMAEMIEFIAISGQHDVIVFGEIYGCGVQKMDYGCKAVKGYRVYDISIDGEYQNWADVKAYCDLYHIPTVPLLYEGPFTPDLIDKFIDGPTTIADPDDILCKFKGREGIVITALEETLSDKLQGRLILKAVSAAYHEAM